MSTIDRAFIRAYSKDLPPVSPAAATERTLAPLPANASPYVVFQMPRRRDNNYRLEPTLTPWVSNLVAPAPHFAQATEQLPAAAPVAISPPLVTASPTNQLLEQLALRQRELLEGTPQASMPRSQSAPVVPVESPIRNWEPLTSFAQLPAASALSVGEYLCISGGCAPSEVHFASAPAGVADDYTPRSVETPEALKTTGSHISKSVPIAEQREPLVNETVPLENIKAQSSLEGTVPACDVLWEVDQFLYPPMTDRLIHSYSYFSQAGAKLRDAARAGLKSLAITGIGRASGRTTLAICLARVAAATGLRVGLLDGDFANPALAANLGVETDQDWYAALRSGSSLPEIAIRSIDNGLTLFALNTRANLPAPRLLERSVTNLIRQAADMVDLLILDWGPWAELETNNAAELPFDAAIVLRDCRHQSEAELLPLAQWLQAAGVEAVGIAENFTAESS